MKEKIKKIVLGYLPGFVTGLIVCGGVSVIAATYFPSNQVTYENGTSGMQATDVQGAIDELYNTCFPPKGSDTITDLLPSNSDELYEDEHGDIRYYGKAPNNYVSFNNELWRIIGVIDGKLKIIRNESIGDRYWASNDSNNWNNSDLKSYLNGGYYNSIDETYKSMVSEETYYLGGATNSNYQTLTASGYYNAERSNNVYSNNPTSTKQYIGLMYPSDYGYASGNSCLSTNLSIYDTECASNNYLYSQQTYEWLQTPYNGNYANAITLRPNGSVGIDAASVGSYKFAIRPSFYLSSSVQITGGDGSQSNPFTLSV